MRTFSDESEEKTCIEESVSAVRCKESDLTETKPEMESAVESETLLPDKSSSVRRGNLEKIPGF